MSTKPKEIVIVFKDRKSRAIETFVNVDGHGARMELSEFLGLLAEAYGNPTTTLSIKGHEKRLNDAAAGVVQHMKEKTREIAAAQFPANPE